MYKWVNNIWVVLQPSFNCTPEGILMIYLYIDSRTLIIQSASSEYICLDQKHNSRTEFSLIFYILYIFSKHLEIIHRMQARTIFHQLLFFAMDPTSNQLCKAYIILPGMIQDMPFRLRAKNHTKQATLCGISVL